ncbi:MULTISPECIES: hypothetical protein [unclassified Streptomyces]|uniref:hypothetical protein n=1 Tax=unclassified Streptomyces TaxID=2593676 RepID=UPI00236716BA|nr:MULTISPECIES: hypothetical protein [unclassified Streptomyces]MDF3139814.1 hypothetical protein [Streptomyces sp. T21Q-yed]WDF42456.1 hypothetical protein PBV52_39500 [Streptomyces sp. T12]
MIRLVVSGGRAGRGRNHHQAEFNEEHIRTAGTLFCVHLVEFVPDCYLASFENEVIDQRSDSNLVAVTALNPAGCRPSSIGTSARSARSVGPLPSSGRVIAAFCQRAQASGIGCI